MKHGVLYTRSMSQSPEGNFALTEMCGANTISYHMMLYGANTIRHGFQNVGPFDALWLCR